MLGPVSNRMGARNTAVRCSRGILLAGLRNSSQGLARRYATLGGRNQPRRCARFVTQCSAMEAVSHEEDEANTRRWEESGNAVGTSDEWRWTLNWDHITDNIIVGSCPRSPEDLDRIANEAGATAVLCLQCDLCLEALKIDWGKIRENAVSQGVLMARVPIRDFDHADQTLMLPEAVRTLAILLAFNNKVYVHCTAGINRATLTVLGYLTFVQGMNLHPALKLIKMKRPQAHPYVDCWKSTKARILQARSEEVAATARKLSESNGHNGNGRKDSFSNWYSAEDLLIKETFRRQLESSLSLISSLSDLKAASVCSVCIMPQEMDSAQQEISKLKEDLEEERAMLRSALAELKSATSAPVVPQQNSSGGMEGDSCTAAFEELANAKQEIESLKQGLRDVAFISAEALTAKSLDDLRED